MSVRMQDTGLSTKQEILNEFGSDIWMPTWVLIVATVTIGVIPWIHWSKRFSLRTLLIAITAVAVVLGLVMWLR
jgi:hypothetical protein